MRVPRLYLDAPLAAGGEIELPRDRVHYLRHVLRLPEGADLILFDGCRPLNFPARLRLQGKQTRVEILSEQANSLESPLDSHLLQAVGKADALDWLVQKATELGLRRLVLFNSERTQTPLRGSRLDKKRAHWRAVAASACEQCGRSLLPSIEILPDLDAALDSAPEGLRLMLDFEGQPLQALAATADTAVSCLVGPEGGFNTAEIERARGSGFAGWRLGPRVLRMETAATAALTLLQQRFGDLN